MAFQLRGLSPKIHDGKMIRFNIWTWHRIWLALEEISPDLVKDIKLWYANSGTVVDDHTAQEMANIIENYGNEKFARLASYKIDLKQQHNVSERALVSAIEFEIQPFIDFLRNSGGFKIT